MSGRSHLRGSVGVPLAARFPFRGGAVAAGGPLDAQASAHGQRETGRPDPSHGRRFLFRDCVLRSRPVSADSGSRPFPGLDHRTRRRHRHHRPEATPHRVTVADGDRDAVRDRRRSPGRRRGRPIELPVERAPDQALRLPTQHRGDRRLQPRSRRRRRRHGWPRARAAGAEPPHPDRAGRQEPRRQLPGDQAARCGDRPWSRGGFGRRQDAITGRRVRGVCVQARPPAQGLSRARQHLLLGHLGDFYRPGLQAARLEQHRRLRDRRHS